MDDVFCEGYPWNGQLLDLGTTPFRPDSNEVEAVVNLVHEGGGENVHPGFTGYGLKTLELGSSVKVYVRRIASHSMRAHPTVLTQRY